MNSRKFFGKVALIGLVPALLSHLALFLSILEGFMEIKYFVITLIGLVTFLFYAFAAVLFYTTQNDFWWNNTQYQEQVQKYLKGEKRYLEARKLLVQYVLKEEQNDLAEADKTICKALTGI